MEEATFLSIYFVAQTTNSNDALGMSGIFLNLIAEPLYINANSVFFDISTSIISKGLTDHVACDQMTFMSCKKEK